jgi:hypothetical protein
MSINYDIVDEQNILIDELRRQLSDAKALADIRARGAYRDGLAFGRKAVSASMALGWLIGFIMGAAIVALAS